MCGISGQVAPGGKIASKSAVRTMNDGLVHRGPDEDGMLDAGFGVLALRRLAIVDIPNGHQPMTTEDGRFSLIYNGEIYDFAPLRRDLEARGRRFRTRSDTEVVLEAYAEYGERCLEMLNGMFAFAILDARERQLFLARDPWGIKPLYYHLAPDGTLTFSSEIASLISCPTVPRKLDRSSLAMLLVDRYVDDPWTMFEGVRQVPPGHWLRWRDGEIEIRPWYRPRLHPEPIDEGEALAELKRLLSETVRSQLVADVPVGVFLSGGIDSSTVAAYAARETPDRLETFSVGFSTPEYDESERARAVAKHLGTTHHEIRIEHASFGVDVLDEIIDHIGQPHGDISSIPTLVVSRLAHERVEVVLSGDGGDEFFGGYDHIFWAARVRRASEQIPAPVRRVVGAMLAGASPAARGFLAGPMRRARRGIELTFYEPSEQLRRLKALWSVEETRRLLVNGDAVELRSLMASDGLESPDLEPEEHAMAFFSRSYLTGAILSKVDRMSMAASLEVRVPLLDRRIVEFASRLPLNLKLRHGRGKYILREAGQDLLPAWIYAHRKQGFSIPLEDWLNAEFWELMDDLYAPGSAASDLFERGALNRVLEDGRRAATRTTARSQETAATRVWLLAMLARWMDRHRVTA